MKNPPSDQLTLLVFKDNRSPRTFQVSLRWLSRVGFLSVGCLIFTLFVSFLAIRFYRQAQMIQFADPEHLRALESQLAILKAQPTPTATNVDSQAPPPPVTSAAGSPASILFQALPASATVSSAPPTLKMQNLRSRWNKHKLIVSFNLEYIGPEGGNQAGRIVILARGSSTLQSYPEGIFNTSDESVLINVDKGEYFSVSRFRETSAQFGPFTSQSAIQDLEILIFGQNQSLLVDQKIKAGTKTAGEAPGVTQPEATPDDTDSSSDSSSDNSSDTSSEATQ